MGSKVVKFRTGFRSIWLLFIGLTSGCAGGSFTTSESSVSWEADQTEIASAMQSSADAWNRGDLTGHLAIYVDSVTFMTQSGPRPGVSAVRESFQTTYFRGTQPVQNLAFEQLNIRRLDDDAALVTGRFVLSGGGQPEQSGWFTLAWVRTAGGWRAVHDHSS